MIVVSHDLTRVGLVSGPEVFNVMTNFRLEISYPITRVRIRVGIGSELGFEVGFEWLYKRSENITNIY